MLNNTKALLSQKAACITPSLTLAITAKAKKMKSEGISIIGFGAGEPDFNTPAYIIDAAKKALDVGFTKYTPSSGMPKLKEVICEKFKKDNGLIYSPSQIIVSSGAKHSIFNVMQALIEEGDEVIIPAPYWLTYPEVVKMCDGTCVFVHADISNDYKATAEQIKAAITPKTKLLILNSPSNPTGAVYNKEELEAIAKVVVESGIYVLSDEIYEKLVYDGAVHYSIASLGEDIKARTIVINGVSKTYAMTGWRVGYLAAPLEIAKAIDSMQSHATSNACSISQYATVVALSGGEDFISEMHNTFDERRKCMMKIIKGIDGLSCSNPKGAFYIMVDFSKLIGKKYKGVEIKNSIDFAEKLLTCGVAVVPGEAFAADNCVRLSYAISIEDIKEGLKRIKAFTMEVV
ncbi:MAG: pyridoxal phosphate-dependent aminotransferase [Clostridia bacterium]